MLVLFPTDSELEQQDYGSILLQESLGLGFIVDICVVCYGGKGKGVSIKTLRSKHNKSGALVGLVAPNASCKWQPCVGWFRSNKISSHWQARMVLSTIRCWRRHTISRAFSMTEHPHSWHVAILTGSNLHNNPAFCRFSLTERLEISFIVFEHAIIIIIISSRR